MLNNLPRIVIVDDYPAAGLVLEVVLRTKGYDCKRCIDAASAIAFLDGFHPDAVIMDVAMPTMNGYTLATAIRARPDGAKYVLVGLSGYGRDEDRRRASVAGMDAYFVKPAQINEMLTSIDYLVASKDASGLLSNRN